MTPFCLLLVILGVIFAPTGSQEINQATTCGQVIKLEEEGLQGTISYKPIESYSANERCTWTIRGPNLSNITFVMVQSGINGSDPYERVGITGFNRPLANPGLDTVFMRNQGDMEIIHNIDVLIITFASGAEPLGRGFVLNYAAVHSNSTPTSRRSIDFVSDSTLPRDELDHPRGGDEQYSNFEISTFLIVPLHFNVGNNPLFSSRWQMLGLEGSCLDRVTVHKFYTDVGWREVDGYCYTFFPIVKYASHRDMMLFVFVTDGSVTNRGFNLHWSVIDQTP